MRIRLTPRQTAFVRADAFEVLYGGAAGGGKSYGQMADALLYAYRYPGSRQLILRRTYGELERTLLRLAMELYPRKSFTYLSSRHEGRFSNGSVLDFGGIENENDVYKYQSAEYDVIRFDELTHFSEGSYRYLLSRVRGANGYPKQVKSTTNPGGPGHGFVKARFIDPAAPDELFYADGTSRLFLPATLRDNPFLTGADPDYGKRLLLLPERERRALLDGDWDVFEGQYFHEFDRRVHTCAPFPIPAHWRRYRALDYGLDMLACYFIALDERGRAYVYKEIYQPGLIASAAAKEILRLTDEPIRATYAPPDLWSRHKDTGRSTAEIFGENGIALSRVRAERVQGWMALKEWLAVGQDEQGQEAAGLCIFHNCRNLIRTLPALCVDPLNPNDVAREPHELTHAPDALRYFVAGRPRAASPAAKGTEVPFFSKKRPDRWLGPGEKIRIV